jgi:hypothetical protein
MPLHNVRYWTLKKHSHWLDRGCHTHYMEFQRTFSLAPKQNPDSAQRRKAVPGKDAFPPNTDRYG